MNRSRPFFWTLAALALVVCQPAAAGSISLSWSPVPGASGYYVYYGTEPGHYTAVADLGAVTDGTIDFLADCRDYYLAVKAYNGAGESAEFSNEVRGWPRPQVTAPTTEVVQGSQVLLEVPGTNFQAGADVIFDLSALPTDAEGNALVLLDAVTVVSCYEIEALLTIEPTARGFRAMQIGEFAMSFEVRNPDSVYGSGPVPLTVRLNEERLDVNRSDSSTSERVDGKDLVWLAYAHGSDEGGDRYNPDADLNGDGKVDGEDLAHLSVEFGACWSEELGWSNEGCQ